MGWRFEPGETLGDAFRRVAAEEIAKVRAGLSDPGNDRAKAIHEARQSFKRLRALLRLAKPSLGAAFDAENRRWRDAGRRLSGSRDSTVLMESFDKIVGGCRTELSAADVAAWRARLAASGPRCDGADAEAHVQEVLAQLDDAERRAASLPWPHDAEALAQGLKRGQARLRQDWQAARKTRDPHALHDWRKRVKDQSAHLRLFRRVAPRALRSRHDAEKEAAELLGEEHDFWMLAERLSSQPAPPEAAAIRDALLREIGARRKRLRRQALKLGAGFSGQKPKAFARELTGAWETASARSDRAGAN